MLVQSHEKATKLSSSSSSVIKIMQATDLSQFPNDSFDTIIDTFGICSVENPSIFLTDVYRVVKPNGKVIFLEHGRAEGGIFKFLINIWLDLRASAHCAFWGCHWNREISRLIEKQGFVIESKQVHHYGTCTEVVGRKPLT
jgi:methyltransferase OMS1